MGPIFSLELKNIDNTGQSPSPCSERLACNPNKARGYLINGKWRQNSILLKWPITDFNKRFLIQVSCRIMWDLCFIDFQGIDLRSVQRLPWTPGSSSGCVEGLWLPTLASHHIFVPRGLPSFHPQPGTAEATEHDVWESRDHPLPMCGHWKSSPATVCVIENSELGTWPAT